MAKGDTCGGIYPDSGIIGPSAEQGVTHNPSVLSESFPASRRTPVSSYAAHAVFSLAKSEWKTVSQCCKLSASLYFVWAKT